MLWTAWGDAAFARAKQEDKPLFVALGFATSELSRAMARQTFANPDTAAFLNENFVCVLVDAKERPDLVALYQSYTSAVKQLSGLPLNIWLTPELKPFEGANYLPPTEEWGKEGFLTVAKRAAAGWKADPAAQRAKADEAIATVLAAQNNPDASADAIGQKEMVRLLAENREAWQARFDSANGGFGDPPKYPDPELLRFLLRDPSTREIAVATLRALCNGAIHDPLDGGFFRYAVDAEWRQPYFQKSALEQARLALALLDAHQIAPDAQFADAARGALNFVLERLALGDGEFAAVEDATAENVIAAHLWTPAEIQDVLGQKDAAEFNRVFTITAEGNLPVDAIPGVTGAGKNLPRRSVAFGDAAAEKALAASGAKLLAKRLARAEPARDDAAVSGAHGLLLAALSRAGAELSEPRFSDAAKAQFAFIRDRLIAPDGSLHRFAGRDLPAAPLDYALVIAGLNAFAAASDTSAASSLASRLTAAANARYWDDAPHAFAAVAPNHEAAFWFRPRPAAFGAGELVSVEAALLPAISSSELKIKLARTIAAEIRDAIDAPRGDLLLALDSAQK